MASTTPYRKRLRTVRHCAIEERLDPTHHAALRAMVLESDMKLVTVMEWLASVGCKTSMASLCRYRQQLRRDCRAEAAAVEDEAARRVAFALLARETPRPDFLTPAVFLCELASVISLFVLPEGDGAPPRKPGLWLPVRHGRAAVAVAELRPLLERRNRAAAEARARAAPAPQPAHP